MRKLILIPIIWFLFSGANLVLNDVTVRDGYVDYTQDANCSGAYRMNDDLHDEALDSSQNGNNSTSIRNVTYQTSCKEGSCWEFNGSTSSISLPDVTELRLSQNEDQTICAWVYLDVYANNGDGSTIIRYDDGDNLDGDSIGTRALYLLRVLKAASGSYLNYVCGITSGTLESTNSDVAIPLTTWTHVCSVRDVSEDTIELFINGESNISATDDSDGTWETTGQYPLIGRFDDNTPSNDEVWDGKLDEIIVLETALTANQIKDIYKHGLK